MMTIWKQIWAAAVENDNLLLKISPGHNIPTGYDLHRICGAHLIEYELYMSDSLHKLGMRNSPECDCGAEKQTFYHIAIVCPVEDPKSTVLQPLPHLLNGR